jgi:BASS family bile acid:Na+ symporter
MVKNLLRNRDFILFLGLTLGLLFHHGAQWTKGLTLPVLAMVMTLSTMGVSASVFRSPRSLLIPVVLGILMNYVVLATVILGMSIFLINEDDLLKGCVILASVPPAVAVIPFSEFLNGNRTYSLMGTVGGYLGALVIMPLIAFWFIGSSFFNPLKLLIFMVELIIAPLVLSRILIRKSLDKKLEPLKGTITNWSFFVVVYTIVGLNHDVFLAQPLSLLPVAFIAIASTFLLGLVIEWIGRIFRADPKITTSLVLLGTLKNYGLAGGISLALFSKQTALPATVSTIFMIVYVIWLGLKRRWSQ